jgi:glycosyltransferase involved in cell wall biosynthesis
VILPTFNRAELLPRAIDSVLTQTHRDLELVVVDDGSSDSTEAVVKAIADERVRLLRLPANRGQAAARNAGIRESRADYVAFQDSDDVWHPDKLRRQVELLRADPDLGGVYCDLDRRRLDGTHFIIEAPTLSIGRFFDRRLSLYQSYGIGIQTCIFRKQVIVEADGFREDLRCFEDLELLLRIAHRRRMQRIPDALVHYYESKASVIKHSGNEQRARRFLFTRYAIRAFPSHPLTVIFEATRCVMDIRRPWWLLNSFKRRLTGSMRRTARRSVHLLGGLAARGRPVFRRLRTLSRNL